MNMRGSNHGIGGAVNVASGNCHKCLYIESFKN